MTKKRWEAEPCACGHSSCKRWFIPQIHQISQLLSKEDAHLIAAAPDMLAALKGLSKWHKTSEGVKNAVIRAKMSMKKAEGKL